MRTATTSGTADYHVSRVAIDNRINATASILARDTSSRSYKQNAFSALM
jgi:hypothetical protein